MLADEDLSEATADSDVRVDDRMRANCDVAYEDRVRSDLRKR